MRLIDADALIKKEERYELDRYIDGERCYEMAVPSWAIIEAPTIEAVVHGEWIAKYEGSYLQRRMYCSVCGKKSGIGGIESNQRKPYCPNCGAKMDGERKESE